MTNLSLRWARVKRPRAHCYRTVIYGKAEALLVHRIVITVGPQHTPVGWRARPDLYKYLDIKRLHVQVTRIYIETDKITHNSLSV